MTVSACRYDNSKNPLEEKTIRFLFVLNLFEVYVFRGLGKTRSRAFCV